MTKIHVRSLSLGLALVLVAAACGGSDGSESSEPPATDSSTPAQSTAAQPTTTDGAETVEAPELGGTSWVVTNYSQGNGVITNVWKTEVTIAFSVDGTVSGSAGCNDYEGTWSVSGGYNEFESGVRDPADGQEIALSQLSWTEMACDDDAIMEQEAEILDLLQRAGRWALVRDAFNLRDADGAFLFETEAAE